MSNKILPLASIICIASFNAYAAPSVSGNTISWPAGDDWYQVQNATNYESICEGGISCNVSPGTYIVINHSTGERWENITVTGDDTASDGVTVNGDTIAWPNDGWYQVQDAGSYENICEGGTSCSVSPGTYIVINHTTGERWEDIEVGTGGGEPEGEEEVVFLENFNNGSLNTTVWEVPSWASNMSSRDFVNDQNQCTVSGTTPSQGHLELEARVVDGSTRSCYMASYERFGPGPDKIMKIEYRVNLSELKAHGAWFAGWLSPLDVVNGVPLAFDEDSSTGHEIDVLEYIPFRKPDGSFDTTNWIHPAVHDGNSQAFSATGNIEDDGAVTSDGYFDANSALLGNVDVRANNYHVYSVEWDGSCHVFSIDGKPFWTNKNAARSTTENHRLLLTMEVDSGEGADGSNVWNHQVFNFQDNVSSSNPARAKVDWVKVSTRPKGDGLCTD